MQTPTSTLSLEQKIGQMLVVGFDGLEAPGYILEWIEQGRIGGVILFARNVSTPQQVAALTRQLHSAAPAERPLLICIDQEGGLVARLRDHFTESPGAMALGAANSAALAEQVSEVLAREMRALGINWNLAPVVDILHNKENPVIGVRSLGRDVERVSELVAAQVKGFQANGVATAVKHFPGHGNTAVDTHVAAAVVRGPIEDIFSHDLLPFRSAITAGASAVMVGHVTFEAVDPTHPATLSAPVIQKFLRQDIGFNGVACTDCLEMNAIMDHYSAGEAAVLAALAGEDIVLVSHRQDRQEAAYDGLLTAARSGRLPIAQIDAATARIQHMKQQFRFNGEFDLDLILHPDHLHIMQEAARAGTVLLRAAADVLPLRREDPRRIGFIEFRVYRQTAVEDPTLMSDIFRYVRHALPEAAAMIQFRDDPWESALNLAASVDILVLAVRSVHLDAQLLEKARQLVKSAKNTVLLCLRNPFDATALAEATTVICSLSDSKPSLQAAVDALIGQFTPDGILPVALD